eukprot:3965762-Prymnesium_polylepis.2
MICGAPLRYDQRSACDKALGGAFARAAGAAGVPCIRSVHATWMRAPASRRLLRFGARPLLYIPPGVDNRGACARSDEHDIRLRRGLHTLCSGRIAGLGMHGRLACPRMMNDGTAQRPPPRGSFVWWGLGAHIDVLHPDHAPPPGKTDTHFT